MGWSRRGGQPFNPCRHAYAVGEGTDSPRAPLMTMQPDTAGLMDATPAATVRVPAERCAY